MEKNQVSKKHEAPRVLDHQPVRFETAHSWNRGNGNEPITGDGNHGIHYKLPPDSNPGNHSPAGGKFGSS